MRQLLRAIPTLGAGVFCAGVLFIATGFGTCGGDDHPRDGGFRDGGPTADGGSGLLQWFTTCGDPVCRVGGWHPKAGIPLCTTEKTGDPCATRNQECDPKDDCNSLSLCTDHDPTRDPGGCPKSRRAYKTEIQYLDGPGLQHYADELQRLKLATYKYKSGGPTHLGFIIEDVEPSVSVDSPRDMVDLYGYTSMAVAAVKLQEQKIAALEQQIAELQKKLESPSKKRSR